MVELAKVIMPENRGDVLRRFFQLSKTEAKAVSAELRPAEAAPHREVVTAVRAAPPALTLIAHPTLAPDRAQELVHPDEPNRAHPREVSAAAAAAPATAAPVPSRAAPLTAADPLTADLSRLHVTVSRGFLRKLEEARAALSHSHPGASAEAVLEAGLDLLLARHAERRGQVEKPRENPRASKSEHIPAHVRRAVWKRDGGRCQWPLESGGICGSTLRVEFDHRTPRALGGACGVDDIRLLCRTHNQHAARLVFGDDWMDRFAGRSKARPTPPRLHRDASSDAPPASEPRPS